MPRLALVLLALLAAAASGCGTGDAARAPAEVRGVHLRGQFVTSYRGRPAEGVAGLRVHLLFRRADGSGWEGARPPSGQSRRHRTFDVLGEDGAFRFDLLTADALSAYDEVADSYADHFRSTEPEQPVELAVVAHFASLLPGRREVLDAGCGAGRMMPLLAGLGCAVTGMDLSPGMVRRAFGCGGG